MIEIKNLYKKYESFKALENINIVIPDGIILGLVGKSGAGKSTLLRTINQLEKVSSGEILVNGFDVTKYDEEALRQYRKKVGMIFQHFSLLETKSIYKNIALPLECLKWNKNDIKNRVLELAEIVGLTDKLDVKPRQLSGGQKQRVAIARALATYPELLLCDEATSALDPITTKQILTLLKEINQKLGITIIVVTHQMEVIKEICEEVVVLENGVVVESGKSKKLFLQSASKLKELSADEEVLPQTGINIRLLYDSSVSEQSIITSLARELDIDFSIVWGKLERFSDDVLGSLIINIKEEYQENVIQYLIDKKVNWEVL